MMDMVVQAGPYAVVEQGLDWGHALSSLSGKMRCAVKKQGLKLRGEPAAANPTKRVRLSASSATFGLSFAAFPFQCIIFPFCWSCGLPFCWQSRG